MSRPKKMNKVYILVKFTESEKVGFASKRVTSFYVNPGVNIHSHRALWKSPVEKVVDNVENCELSTGIPFL